MSKIYLEDSEFNIQEATILKTTQLTENEKLFRLKLLDNKYFYHDPGQFVEVSLLGIGEVPISICSAPEHDNVFEICIRSVGRVTKSLHTLYEGDRLGIRGPFGNGFPIDQLQGNDLILVAGGLGIAPMRSLINYIITNRRDFGNVRILLGCKTPDTIIFGNEIKKWTERVDVDFSCTVDKTSPDWQGNVGLITSLIPGISVIPDKTYAVVIGPPIMYKYVIKELLSKSISEKNIILSLERHMKCGLGKCGHCQIENIYCCQDGPVFSYNEIKNIKGAI
jgi:sulfite reductase subunit B